MFFGYLIAPHPTPRRKSVLGCDSVSGRENEFPLPALGPGPTQANQNYLCKHWKPGAGRNGEGPFNRPNKGHLQTGQAVPGVPPFYHALAGRKGLSERCVLVVNGPQVAPGGGVQLVIRVSGTAGGLRLGLQVPKAVGQFLRRRQQVEYLLWGRRSARKRLRAEVGEAQL